MLVFVFASTGLLLRGFTYLVIYACLKPPYLSSAHILRHSLGKATTMWNTAPPMSVTPETHTQPHWVLSLLTDYRKHDAARRLPGHHCNNVMIIHHVSLISPPPTHLNFHCTPFPSIQILTNPQVPVLILSWWLCFLLDWDNWKIQKQISITS